MSCAAIMPSISSCGAIPISPVIAALYCLARTSLIGLLDPERLNRLVAENGIPAMLRSARQGHVRTGGEADISGPQGKSEEQPHAKQIAPARHDPLPLPA